MKNLLFLLLLFPLSSIFGQTDSLKVFTSLADIKDAPEEVFIISLKKKKLKEFPKEILNCKNLRQLDLSSNKIKEIPESIQELQHLEKLILANNDLTTFPDAIGDLKELKYLDANRNYIYILPDSFGNLAQLDTLILWSNAIREFPQTMSVLNLQLLDIRAIDMNFADQKKIFSLFPNTKIKYARACNCY